MKFYKNIFCSLFALVMLAACTQTTSSMMNTSRVQLAQETLIDQIALKDINENSLENLATQYHKYGSGPLDLTMTFDPKAKGFTAMQAVKAVKHVESVLRKKGIQNLMTQTMAVNETSPALLVTFDTVTAMAPDDCQQMPGMESNETSRFIGDYKFGCGVETLFAKQIARPADLNGNAELDTRDARREAIITEAHSSGDPKPRLEGLERGNLSAN